MLDRLRKYRSAGPRKKEFFTIMILPGPNSRVHKFSISKTLLRNAGIAALVAMVLGAGMLGEYLHMWGKVVELDSLRAQSVQQKEQLQQFASSVVDMKAQMAHLKDLSEKLTSMAGMGGRGKRSQFLGMGGSSEMSRINLDELGKKTHKEQIEQMTQELDGLKSDAAQQEASLAKLTSYFEHRNSVQSATPGSWPMRGFITSEFGYRTSPIYGSRQFHEGLDIANSVGTPVAATANGTVTETGYNSGYGRFVKIQHGFGMVTLYGHLSRATVTQGQRVKKGEIIGASGNTGSSTGPHLHYEVWVNGVPTNPRKYL